MSALLILSAGVIMSMFGQTIPPCVNLGVEILAADILAVRKVIMAAGHAHKTHPCNVCFIAHADINTAETTDSGTSVLPSSARDPRPWLSRAFWPGPVPPCLSF